MNYRQSLEYVESLEKYGIVPGLDNIKELCRRIGNPQDALKFVHIAGTNGKGSTLAYISTILQCAGYRVGRYISPVIEEYREKIQVNQKPITQKAFCEGIELIRQACSDMVAQGLTHPTPFEVETALSFWYFWKKNCDIVVLETGMGGENDATNLITTTQVAVLASIGMDHMQFLGKSLTEIAGQKAGIIKENAITVSMLQKEEVMQVVTRAADKKKSPLCIADEKKAVHVHYGLTKQRFDYGGYKGLEITLAGTYQIANAILAIEAVRALEKKGYSISEQALRQGLRQTEWYGRFSVIAQKPYFIVDGAHNEDSAQKLAESIEFYFTNKRIIYIMGILKDKEYEKIIGLTHKYADQIITVTPQNSRALHAYELAQEVAKAHPSVTAVDSLEEAVEISRMLADKEDVIIAFGSLSYLGKLKKIVNKDS